MSSRTSTGLKRNMASPMGTANHQMRDARMLPLEKIVGWKRVVTHLCGRDDDCESRTKP